MSGSRERLQSDSTHIASSHDRDKLDARNHTTSNFFNGWAPWVQRWKTFLTVMGLFLLALTFALGHYLFFRRINGLPVEEFIAQSYVSSISLLLVTGFRACIVGSATISFTQYLWKLLRQRALRISMIEQLFQILHNPFILANIRVFRKAPILFIMAVLLWLAPIATIYPPGSLVVASQPFTFTENLNISVINPGPPENFNASDPFKTFSILASYGTIGCWSRDIDCIPGYEYQNPTQAMKTLTRSIMGSGNRLAMPTLNRQNTSYSLVFRVPQLSCETTVSNSRYLLFENYTSSANTTGRSAANFGLPVPGRFAYTAYNNSWNSNDTFTTVLGQYVQGWFHLDHEIPEGQSGVLSETYLAAETTKQSCKSFSALLTLNITDVNNDQRLSWSKADLQPIFYEGNDPYGTFEVLERPGKGMSTEDWTASVEERIKTWNTFALLEAPMKALYLDWDSDVALTKRPAGTFTLPDGQIVELNDVDRLNMAHNETTLENSVFNTIRFYNGHDFFFHPSEHLNTTEAILNEFLLNVSISSVSIGNWYRLNPVDITEFRNVYTFSSPLSLILPYSICLFLGLIINILGFCSLVANGEAAEDGGFLQIMTTTRGDTEMDRLARRMRTQGRTGFDKDLLNLKVRYGKIVNEDDLEDKDGEERNRKALGFGTANETVPMRWRGRKDTMM